MSRDPHPEARALCRAVLASWPGAVIVKLPLSRTAAKAARLPLPALPTWSLHARA